MSNVRVLPPDAFILNCKMMRNDLCEIRERVRRMWACATDNHDILILEELETMLDRMSDTLKDRLDN